MIRIIADDKIPFIKGVLEPYASVMYLPGREITNNVIKQADALLIRTRTKCTREMLQDSGVRFIGTATIGFDHIDTRYCNRQGIEWINSPGCNSSSVTQYIAAALLKLSRDFQFSLKEKTLGIVGVGNVGSKVEQLARILGMNIMLNDPPRARREGNDKFTDLNTLLAGSDIITLHVPLKIVGEDKTYHMINERRLKKFRKGTWLINSSRGEVADTPSLRKALDSGRLAGAIIDVWEHEPDIDLELMHSTFIATPHIAGYSSDGKANGTAMVVNGLSAFFGIPVRDWYPGDIPQPEKPVISIDGKGKDEERIIREAVWHTYDIAEDDTRMRFSPSDFEKQRGDYPVRREFTAYSVKAVNVNRNITGKLEKLGFKMQG